MTAGVCRDEISGADFGQEEERVGHNTGGEYQVTSRANKGYLELTRAI